MTKKQKFIYELRYFLFSVKKMYNNHKVLTKTRIPLDELPPDQQKEIKRQNGRILVFDSDEPCLTCGRHHRIKYLSKVDGRTFIVEECLYCIVRVKTARNRETQ